MDFLTGALGTILPFLFVLALVVIIHELGHFLVGRWCGVEVKTFSVGFGPELFGFTDRRGTRWRLAAIPLGGYVKFLGDSNAASVPDNEAAERLSAEEKARSFPHKRVGQRAAIVAAGPIANFLLAIAIFSGTVYLAGRQVLSARVDTVQPGTAAESAGFKSGDVVVSINGNAIESFGDMQRIVSSHAGLPLNIVVNRDGAMQNLVATPQMREIKTPLGVQRIGILGLQASRDPAAIRTEHYGLMRSLQIGVHETWYIVERTFSYVGGLFAGRESADQLSGPIRIAQVSGAVASAGFLALLNLAAVLSVSIGLINLVPVPLLDGGHLLFYAIEWVRGRPLSERAQEFGFKIGLALVLMLMLFATWNDIITLSSS